MAMAYVHFDSSKGCKLLVQDICEEKIRGGMSNSKVEGDYFENLFRAMGPILQRICGETEPRVYSEGSGGVRPQLLSLNVEDKGWLSHAELARQQGSLQPFTFGFGGKFQYDIGYLLSPVARHGEYSLFSVLFQDESLEQCNDRLAYQANPPLLLELPMTYLPPDTQELWRSERSENLRKQLPPFYRSISAKPHDQVLRQQQFLQQQQSRRLTAALFASTSALVVTIQEYYVIMLFRYATTAAGGAVYWSDSGFADMFGRNGGNGNFMIRRGDRGVDRFARRSNRRRGCCANQCRFFKRRSKIFKRTKTVQRDECGMFSGAVGPFEALKKNTYTAVMLKMLQWFYRNETQAQQQQMQQTVLYSDLFIFTLQEFWLRKSNELKKLFPKTKEIVPENIPFGVRANAPVAYVYQPPTAVLLTTLRMIIKFLQKNYSLRSRVAEYVDILNMDLFQFFFAGMMELSDDSGQLARFDSAENPKQEKWVTLCAVWLQTINVDILRRADDTSGSLVGSWTERFWLFYTVLFDAFVLSFDRICRTKGFKGMNRRMLQLWHDVMHVFGGQQSYFAEHLMHLHLGPSRNQMYQHPYKVAVVHLKQAWGAVDSSWGYGQPGGATLRTNQQWQANSYHAYHIPPPPYSMPHGAAPRPEWQMRERWADRFADRNYPTTQLLMKTYLRIANYKVALTRQASGAVVSICRSQHTKRSRPVIEATGVLDRMHRTFPHMPDASKATGVTVGSALATHAPCLRLSHAAHHSREVNGVYKRPMDERSFKEQIAIVSRCKVHSPEDEALWKRFKECVEVVDWNETNALATFWRKDQEGENLPFFYCICFSHRDRMQWCIFEMIDTNNGAVEGICRFTLSSSARVPPDMPPYPPQWISTADEWNCIREHGPFVRVLDDVPKAERLFDCGLTRDHGFGPLRVGREGPRTCDADLYLGSALDRPTTQYEIGMLASATIALSRMINQPRCLPGRILTWAWSFGQALVLDLALFRCVEVATILRQKMNVETEGIVQFLHRQIQRRFDSSRTRSSGHWNNLLGSNRSMMTKFSPGDIVRVNLRGQSDLLGITSKYIGRVVRRKERQHGGVTSTFWEVVFFRGPSGELTDLRRDLLPIHLKPYEMNNQVSFRFLADYRNLLTLAAVYFVVYIGMSLLNLPRPGFREVVFWAAQLLCSPVLMLTALLPDSVVSAQPLPWGGQPIMVLTLYWISCFGPPWCTLVLTFAMALYALWAVWLAGQLLEVAMGVVVIFVIISTFRNRWNPQYHEDTLYQD